MTRAFIVIGSNLGDEGKGIITDYLTRLHALKICVRFSGGAQAGHTVTVSNGPRHVFSHFGAGTFAGAITKLDEYFIVNPILFLQEAAKLDVNGEPIVHAHPNCRVTTPWDMLINQAAERARSERHGSCGVGINETVERCKRDEYDLRLYEIANWKLRGAILRGRLRAIANDWTRHRMHQLGLQPVEVQWTTDDLIDKFMTDSAVFAKRIVMSSEAPSSDAVYEGAQGLMLDEDAPDFPHVTRGKTGIDNLIKTGALEGFDEIEIVYVTRPYVTRHGNGPLRREFEPSESMLDATNVTNSWQGALRYGRLDPDELAARVDKDFASTLQIRDVKSKLVRKSLAITCMDQEVPSESKVEMKNRIIKAVKPTGSVYTSSGPTAKDVQCMKSLEAIERGM